MILDIITNMITTIQEPTARKSRKDYHCDYCYELINKGTKYIHSVYSFDGDIYQFRTHIHCDKICDILNMHDTLDDGVSQSLFQECIIEEYYKLNNVAFEDKSHNNVSFEEMFNFVLNHYKLI